MGVRPNQLRYACLFLVVPFTAEAQSRPTPAQTAEINRASEHFCQSALLENSGPAPTMSGNTKARLGKVIERFSGMGMGQAADLRGEAATRSLQAGVTDILVTSTFCERDLAGLLTREIFPDAGPAETPTPSTLLQDRGLVGHYLGTVTNVTRSTDGAITLDIASDGNSLTVHLHTEIVTRNDADLRVASVKGPVFEASGLMRTSRGIVYNCHLLMRRISRSAQATVLKGDFEIDPISDQGSVQAYRFEAKSNNGYSIP